MTNDHGNSPLHYSCFYNHEACTIFLVGECNALVNVLNRYGKSPLSHSNTNLQEKLQLLVDQSQTDTIVAKARSFADAEIENKLNFLTKGIFI